ncbi:MAG: hypothetical protein V1892_02745 [bacterium]
MFKRSKKNPILEPDKNHPWEALKVYNCATLYEDNKYHLFYRGVGKNWVSSIGYAVSEDGEKFTRFSKPLLKPDNELEKQGVEDPRITKINDTYYLTYAAYDSHTARLNLATSKDLKKWQRYGPILPDWNFKKAGGFLIKWDEARKRGGSDWSKAGGIFPEKIDNKYWLLFGDSNIWLANSQDGLHWQPIWQPFVKPRKGDYFDQAHLEMGPPPIETKKGWLVLYHGIDDKIVYRLGFLLLDLRDPVKILYRSEKPIFKPKELYELSGLVDILPGGFKEMGKMSKEKLAEFIKKEKKIGKMPQVIFCCGAVVAGDILRIYYGASDSFICTATNKLDNILDIYTKK